MNFIKHTLKIKTGAGGFQLPEKPTVPDLKIYPHVYVYNQISEKFQIAAVYRLNVRARSSRIAPARNPEI